MCTIIIIGGSTTLLIIIVAVFIAHRKNRSRPGTYAYMQHLTAYFLIILYAVTFYWGNELIDADDR